MSWAMMLWDIGKWRNIKGVKRKEYVKNIVDIFFLC